MVAEKLINKTRIWPLSKLLVNERNLPAQNVLLLRRNRHKNLSCFTPFSSFSLHIPKRNIFWRVTAHIRIFKFKLPFIYFICFFFYPEDLIVLKLIKEAYFHKKQSPAFWYFHFIRVMKMFEVECRCIIKNLSKLFYTEPIIFFLFFVKNTNAKVKGRESFRIFQTVLVSFS